MTFASVSYQLRSNPQRNVNHQLPDASCFKQITAAAFVASSSVTSIKGYGTAKTQIVDIDVDVDVDVDVYIFVL